MAQQMVNGSEYDGSRTITVPMSDKYAVVGEPFNGKHCKTEEQRKRRHLVNVLKRKKLLEEGEE